MDILNVTREEFSKIMDLKERCCALHGPYFDDNKWRMGLNSILGTELYYGAFKVIVRSEVPKIPWHPLNILRIEKAA